QTPPLNRLPRTLPKNLRTAQLTQSRLLQAALTPLSQVRSSGYLSFLFLLTCVSLDAIKGSETDGSKLIPGFLPTFGVSSKSQLWIYAAVVVIFLFVSGLGIFLCIQRRKRTGGATGYKEVGDDYEFEDIEGETAGTMGKQTRKARDLYDAFGAS